MATLKLTAKSQVTFRKDLLRHLGVQPGGKIEVDLLPGGRASLKAVQPSGTIDGFLGLLANKTTKVATLEEIQEAIEAGWAGGTLNIAPDSNILIRAQTRDDPAQAAAADEMLRAASSIIIALPCLCEFVWVLRRVYRVSASDVHSAISALLNTRNVIFDRPAVESGLAFLQAGGDFADGVIAYQSKWMGAEVFISFDRKAVELSNAQGYAARLLA